MPLKTPPLVTKDPQAAGLKLSSRRGSSLGRHILRCIHPSWGFWLAVAANLLGVLPAQYFSKRSDELNFFLLCSTMRLPVWLTSQVPAIRPCYTSRMHCPTEPHRPFLLILIFGAARYPRFAGRLLLGVPWTFRFGPVIQCTRRAAAGADGRRAGAHGHPNDRRQPLFRPMKEGACCSRCTWVQLV